MDRLYVSRKEGERGLASIEESIDVSTHKKSKERLITAIKKKKKKSKNKQHKD